jgi:hypothetical protein
MSMAQAVTSDPMFTREKTDRTVFVIELLSSQSLAFEARSHSDADELTRSPWFTRALDRFFSKGPGIADII